MVQCFQTYWERFTISLYRKFSAFVKWWEKSLSASSSILIQRLGCTKFGIVQKAILDPLITSWCISSNYGLDGIIFVVEFSHICGHEVVLSYSRTFELRESPMFFGWRLGWLHIQEICPHVQYTTPSLQHNRHSLHCDLGSVSNNSNRSTLPMSLIIFLDVALNGL